MGPLASLVFWSENDSNSFYHEHTRRREGRNFITEAHAESRNSDCEIRFFQLGALQCLSGEVSESLVHHEARSIFATEKHMKNQNESRSRNIWVDYCRILLFIGVAVSIFLSSVSETTKMLLLGSGLLVAAVWGRRKLRQG